jgi:hypothetical protein
MKYYRTLCFVLTMVMLVSDSSLAQDGGMPMPRDEGQYKELITLRSTTVLIEMELSASSEKGKAVLDLINKQGFEARDFHLTREDLVNKLENAVKISSGAEEITSIIEELEELERNHHKAQIDQLNALSNILTPLERVKFYLADKKFRMQLRRLLQLRHQRLQPGREPRRFRR